MNDRQRMFVKAICNAWDETGHSGGCVMDESDKSDDCNRKNCMIYQIAIDTLAKLDVHRIYRGALPQNPKQGD